MAKINKEQYLFRNESAVKHNIKNEETVISNGMTEEQAEALSELCAARHSFHCNIESIAANDEHNRKGNLIKVNAIIRESGLDPMSFIPSFDDDFIDIDDLNLLIEIEGNEHEDDEQEREEWLSGEH